MKKKKHVRKVTRQTGEEKSKKASEAFKMWQIWSLNMTSSQISPQSNNPFSTDPDSSIQTHPLSLFSWKKNVDILC